MDILQPEKKKNCEHDQEIPLKIVHCHLTQAFIEKINVC